MNTMNYRLIKVSINNTRFKQVRDLDNPFYCWVNVWSIKRIIAGLVENYDENRVYNAKRAVFKTVS
mgnify:CR=1 FL=1